MQDGASRKSGAIPAWLRTIIIGRRPKATLIRVAILVAGSIGIFGFILLPIRITGPSMAPTYQDGSVNFINRLAYVFHEPTRGDIVGIRFTGYRLMLCKRVVGLPGETVEFIRGCVYINGEPLNEPYVKYPCYWNRKAVKLREDQYFVVGDNRSMVMADHMFGEARREKIVGKTLL